MFRGTWFVSTTPASPARCAFAQNQISGEGCNFTDRNDATRLSFAGGGICLIHNLQGQVGVLPASKMQHRENVAHNALQHWTVTVAGLARTVPADQFDLGPHILRALDHSKPAGVCQIAVNRPDLAPENAVNRNSQRGSFPVHRASTAYD